MDQAVLIQLAKGAIPPGVFALLVFGLLWLKAPRGGATEAARKEPRDWRHTLGPLMGALVVLASWPIAFSLSFPPADTFARLPWIWLGFAIAQVGITYVPQRWGRIAAGVASVLIVSWLVVPGAQLGFISAGQIAALALCAALSIGWIAETARSSPRLAAILQFVTLAGASQVLILAFSSLKLGQAAGILAAIAGGVVALTLWKRREIGGRGLEAFLLSAAVVTMFSGIHTTDTPRAWLYVFLISVVPAASMLVYSLVRKSDRLRIALALLTAMGVVGVAVGIAFMNQPVSEY